MSAYSVAIIGTGPHPDADADEGYSMGYRHARSYRVADGCKVCACADIVTENAKRFGEAFDLPEDRVYTDHRQLLEEVRPDIVSICTPPATHLELVTDCARTDSVRAIHCEKPLAVTFGESRRVLEVCREHGVQLTVNLQNRCSDAVAEVRALVSEGAIGELERIEFARHDLLQTGIHHVDLANYILDDEPVEWVLGQIDYPDEAVWYTDMHVEAQSLGMWEYESGVHGLCSTGAGMDAVGRSTTRVIGTEGRIEMDLGGYEFAMRTTDSGGWIPIDVGNPTPQENAVRIVVEALDGDDDPLVSGDVGLAATEIVFAIWESARRRGRIELPLTIDDNPLESLVRSGKLPPSA